MESFKKIALFGLAILAVFIFINHCLAADYFPLRLGNTWIYQTDSGADMVMKVVAIEEISGLKYFVLEYSSGGQSMQKDYYARSGNDIVSAKSISAAQGMMEITFDPPKTWLKYPMFKGRTWSEEIIERQPGINDKDLKPTLRTYEVLDQETTIVPAGKFDCYKINITKDIGGNNFLRSLWYADGVGLVKEIFSDSDSSQESKTTFELKEYKLN
jgi:hypothetical protein